VGATSGLVFDSVFRLPFTGSVRKDIQTMGCRPGLPMPTIPGGTVRDMG
jgi:hypothetical protein